MELGSQFSQVLSELALQLPVIITIVACMVVLLVRWKPNPGVSALAITGLALILIHIPVFTTIYSWAPLMLPKNSTSSDFTNLFFVIGLIFNITYFVAIAPLLAAIFIKRRR